ncbi:hypothetical protein T492DRAFT_839093 [Pavlovales sp. CCMP2436]|nr:hypothetical protein T492DRAFT_839093 [Pavlovales sp. CCMP2436]
MPVRTGQAAVASLRRELTSAERRAAQAAIVATPTSTAVAPKPARAPSPSRLGPGAQAETAKLNAKLALVKSELSTAKVEAELLRTRVVELEDALADAFADVHEQVQAQPALEGARLAAKSELAAANNEAESPSIDATHICVLMASERRVLYCPAEHQSHPSHPVNAALANRVAEPPLNPPCAFPLHPHEPTPAQEQAYAENTRLAGANAQVQVQAQAENAKLASAQDRPPLPPSRMTAAENTKLAAASAEADSLRARLAELAAELASARRSEKAQSSERAQLQAQVQSAVTAQEHQPQKTTELLLAHVRTDVSRARLAGALASARRHGADVALLREVLRGWRSCRENGAEYKRDGGGGGGAGSCVR